MVRVRLMYWKEVPLQVQAEDESGKLSQPLDNRFQEGADAISMFDGSSGSDDYMNGFTWGPYTEVDGTLDIAATTLAECFNTNFPQDFVARIRDMHRSGERDPKPGTIDHWCGNAEG